MERERQFLVRTVSDGKVRSAVGRSARRVALAFMREHDLPLRTEIEVKPRGDDAPWESFTVIPRTS